MTATADVIIIGGGVMGSSAACNLLSDGLDGRLVVFERDPVHERSSTGLSAGGIRQQFGYRDNVLFSRYSVGFFERFGELMAVDGEAPEIDFRQKGYLILAGEDGLAALRRRYELQRSLGVEVSLLTPEEAQARVPHLSLEGIAAAAFCPRDGYLDPYAVMAGYEKKARSLGADYRAEAVVGVTRERGRVAGVVTAGGEQMLAPIVVNAAGPWAGEVGTMAGVEVPVVPVRRHVFTCKIPAELDYELPMVVDPSGVFVRTETGGRILTGRADPEEPAGFNFAPDRSYFLDVIWPALAGRLPLLDRVGLERFWAGLYEVTPDHNAIIGEHPDLPGFYLIGGFSGHGMMQAPAAGRALADLILKGRYEAVDATPYCLERFARGELIHEETVI
ncbi:MAG: FAD-binding oxidoreductase [bacterium]|nr:FAD-binding oxidoreductase [bacterium]